MYDQWGVMFKNYDQEDIDLAMGYVMFALEQQQTIIEEMKKAISAVDDCIDQNQDDANTNFWFLNKNSASIN